MAHSRRWLVWAVLLVSVGWAGCPGDDDGQRDGALPPSDGALDAGLDAGSGETVTANIGPEGGSLTTDTGASIEIPPGALSSPTEISITTGPGGVAEPPWTTPARGPIYELTPHGITFDVPVTVSFPHGGGDTANLALVTLDQGSTEWSEVAGSSVEGDAVVASVTGFSFFVIADGLIRWWPSGTIGSTACVTSVTGSGSLFAASDGAFVWTSMDGISWTDRTDNLPALGAGTIRALAFSQGDLLAGTDNGVYRAAGGQTPWTSVNSGLPTDTYGSVMGVGALGIVTGGVLAALSGDQFSTGGVFVSSDQGDTWEARSQGLDPYAAYRSFVEHGAWYLGVLNDGVWYSTDMGASWARRDTTDPDYGSFTEAFDLASVSGVLYACTEKGIYRSMGYLQSWELRDVHNSPPPWASYIPCNTIRPFGDYVLAGYLDMGVYASRDQGETWAASSIGLARRPAGQAGYLSVEALFGQGDTVVAGAGCQGAQFAVVMGP